MMSCGVTDGLAERAFERDQWAAWGQTLRSESISLERNECRFTKSFFASCALERMLESIFLIPLEDEDKKNLLFVMKNCLLNDRVKGGSVGSPNGPGPSSLGASTVVPDEKRSTTTIANNIDFVEKICGRLVRLGEEYIKMGKRQQQYFADCCNECEGDEELVLHQAAAEELKHARLDIASLISSALGALKLKPRDEELCSASNLWDSPGEQSSGSLTLLTTTLFQEPDSVDDFDAASAPGVFKKGGQVLMNSDETPDSPDATLLDDQPSMPVTSTMTTMTTTSSITSTFCSPLPVVSPSHLADLDSWALYKFHLTIRKMAEVFRELTFCTSQREYDEDVRYQLDENLSRMAAVREKLARFREPMEVFRERMFEAKRTLAADREQAMESIAARMREEHDARDHLLAKLEALREEMRNTESEIKNCERRLEDHQQILTHVDADFSERDASAQARLEKACHTLEEFDLQDRAIQLAHAFVNGVKASSADETTLNLKLQESIVEEQGVFALQLSDESIRRLGVVVAKLDNARNILREFLDTAGSSADGGSPAPTSPPASTTLRHAYLEATTLLQQRVEWCREVANRAERLVGELQKHGFETSQDLVLPLRAMSDAVDCCNLDADAATSQTRVLGASFATSSMNSRAGSSTELFADGNTTLDLSNSHQSGCGGTTAKRKTGLPTSLQRARRALKKRAEKDPSSHGPVCCSALSSTDLASIPAAVRSILSELERMSVSVYV